MNFVAKNLLCLRNFFDITQVEMAALLGVSQPTWENYENGQHEPEIIRLVYISDYFKVSIDDIVRMDLEENVHLIKKVGEKNRGKNVNLNVPEGELPMVNEPDTAYEREQKQEIDRLILRQLNLIAEDVQEIKGRLK